MSAYEELKEKGIISISKEIETVKAVVDGKEGIEEKIKYYLNRKQWNTHTGEETIAKELINVKVLEGEKNALLGRIAFIDAELADLEVFIKES